MNRPTLFAATLTLAALLAGCNTSPYSSGASAEAMLSPTKGNNTHGTVTLMQTGNTVRLDARVSGLTPGSHGFHIHEKGDCSAPDATSAGGHFNPTSQPHGSPDQTAHHLGDMPMLVADAQGNASLSATLQGVTLSEGTNSIVSRSLIVHAAPDDFKTQPTGNSGGRVACGVIAQR